MRKLHPVREKLVIYATVYIYEPREYYTAAILGRYFFFSTLLRRLVACRSFGYLTRIECVTFAPVRTSDDDDDEDDEDGGGGGYHGDGVYAPV